MMNPRERTLAIIVGTAVGLGAVYQVVNFLFIKPVAAAEKEIADLEQENRQLDGVLRSRRNLADRWIAAVGHTLDFDRNNVLNRLAQDLKNLAQRHGFEKPLFTPTSGSKIGTKTGITTVSYRVVFEGRYQNAIDFLKDIHKVPYWCEISKLTLAPIGGRNRPRDEVKVEFTVETPLLPQINKTRKKLEEKIPEVEVATPLPTEGFDTLGPARDDLPPDEALALLNSRNIFRPYVPPPPNVVMIDNQDWKTVVVRAKFFWEGEVNRQTVDGSVVDEIVKTVASKSSLEIRGLGDSVEIQGTYADGKTFGPQKLDFAAKKDWTYAVAMHHPPPPPTVVNLAAENKNSADVDLDIAITYADGKTRNQPTIRLRGTTTIDVGEFEVKSLTATATYPSGRKATPATYTPQKDKQTYVVPVEPIEVAPVVEQDPSDQPPDPTLKVTGLVTYRGKQELIASAGPTDRRVISAGEEAVVDGGMLLGVHPLGGVVRMPSGNYYLYPLGRPFAERVKLEAKTDEELPAAIDAWSRPHTPDDESEMNTAAIEPAVNE